MLFSRSGQSIFPLLPPYGAHDPNRGPGRIIPLHPDGITPYLGLRSHLSQIWMNPLSILIVLDLVIVLFAVTSLETSMDSAQREALAACTSVESMGSTMASMPHYLSQGVNDLTAMGVESAVNGLHQTLTLIVTGVEELVVFLSGILYQLFLCLAELVIRGTVEVGLKVIKEATDYIDSAIQGAGDDLASIASSFSDKLDSFVSGINSITSVFGADEIPTLDVSGLVNTLEKAHLPSGIDESLNKINSSVPNFDEARNHTENFIRIPFEDIKSKMNESMGNFTFDRTTLPVPAKKQLSFCGGSDGIDSFFSDISHIAETARKIFIAVLIVVAILLCIVTAWQEIRRWRCMKERSQLVTRDAHDPMDVVYIVSRPFSAALGIKAASRFSNSRRQILVRWIIAYATSPPALIFLWIALAGFIACLCQYILIQAVEKAVPELSAQVAGFADKVVASLDASSQEWSDTANGVIADMNTKLNEDIFGWVESGSQNLNDTLNDFVDTSTGVMKDTWADTALLGPVQGVFNCLIGYKVEKIQKGLTWVQDNAHINFPLLANDTLSKGAAASISDSNTDPSDSFLADKGSSTADKITEVIARVTNGFEASIRLQALVSAAFLLVYLLNFFIGVIRAMSLFWKQEKNRGDGGAPPPAPIHLNSFDDANGFTNVPLTAVPQNHQIISDRSQPAPRYEPPVSTNRSVPGLAVSRDTFYEDEKLGFAGHRNALQVSGVSHLRGSSYVEYGGGKC